MLKDYLIPSWPAPKNVKAIFTTRKVAGLSKPPYHFFNLGDHVGENLAIVIKNRLKLQDDLAFPSAPIWLNQVHGGEIVDLDLVKTIKPSADASFTTIKNQVCVAMTADCLPILLCDIKGTAVAALHCGWKSLANNIIANSIAALPVAPNSLIAWLGPAITKEKFIVKEDVLNAFAKYISSPSVFIPAQTGKWFFDIYSLAELMLNECGVNKIFKDQICTYQHPELFYSARRDKITGRMAALIWIEK
jgi:polyphenol oxidase